MKKENGDLILAVDIGGSHIKGTIMDSEGVLQMAYQKVDTPSPTSPENVIAAIKKLIHAFPGYDKVSIGFPGYVKEGVTITAPNLGTKVWQGFNLRKALEDALDHPVQLYNDADMQGVGIASGNGFEIVLTLGTGFGSAFLMNGILLPHIELSQHPILKKKTYDEYLGQKAFDKIGKKEWNKRMKKVLTIFKTVFNYDRLYVSGGNGEKIEFKLDSNIKIVSNQDGIKGGAKLWQMAP